MIYSKIKVAFLFYSKLNIPLNAKKNSICSRFLNSECCSQHSEFWKREISLCPSKACIPQYLIGALSSNENLSMRVCSVTRSTVYSLIAASIVWCGGARGRAVQMTTAANCGCFDVQVSACKRGVSGMIQLTRGNVSSARHPGVRPEAARAEPWIANAVCHQAITPGR